MVGVWILPTSERSRLPSLWTVYSGVSFAENVRFTVSNGSGEKNFPTAPNKRMCSVEFARIAAQHLATEALISKSQ